MWESPGRLKVSAKKIGRMHTELPFARTGHDCTVSGPLPPSRTRRRAAEEASIEWARHPQNLKLAERKGDRKAAAAGASAGAG